MGKLEPSFPRGGTVSDADQGKTKTKSDKSLFKQKKTQKPKKAVVKQHTAFTHAALKVTSADDLSYKTLSEGMLVIGRIQNITEYYLHIALPGLIYGKVPLTQISRPYSSLLQAMSTKSTDEEVRLLPELFYKGQLVTTKVTEIQKTTDNRTVVTLSLDPNLIHADWSHEKMAKKDLVITAAVRSIEEHGYVMDCGVNDLRCFLKKENAVSYSETYFKSRPLGVGELVRCVIKKAETSGSASKIEVSADPEDVAQAEENGGTKIDVQQLVPGMRFKLKFVEPILNGVKVQFHQHTAYISSQHLPRTSEDTEFQFEADQFYYGRLLYVLPTVKTIYFSMMPSIADVLREHPKPSSAELFFKPSDTVNSARVIKVTGKGVLLGLGKVEHCVRGFVPTRRANFKNNDEADEQSFLQRFKEKYQLGDKVKCRLLSYDSLSDVFVCSMEKSVLKEKYLHLSNVQVGDVVPCEVEEIRNGGISVRVGMLQGFVPALHSADVPLRHPAKKYQSGSKINGRILKIDNDSHRLIITFKQALVKAEKIISSYKNARKGEEYFGTVVAVRPKGVWVSFFGSVRGFLEFTKHTIPDDLRFSLGQLIKCYIVRRNKTQLRLSLLPVKVEEHNKKANKAVMVGQQYSLEVIEILDSGLKVRVIDDGEVNLAVGTVPVLHLCDDKRLAPFLLKTYELGTQLLHVWCYSKSAKNILVFSLRTSVKLYFQSIYGKIASKKTLEGVVPGSILPCTIQKIASNGIALSVPLPQIEKDVWVESKQVCHNSEETIENQNFEVGQGIQAKILKVNVEEKTIRLGCKVSQIWNGELESSVNYLSKYLLDHCRLLQHAKDTGDPLGEFDTGSEVSGVVLEHTEWGIILDLGNGVKGEATFFNSADADYQIGCRVVGKVLFVDCIRRHVEITLSKEVCSALEKVSENVKVIDTDVQLRGVTLAVTPEFTVMQVKGSGQGRLAFVPTKLYPRPSVPLTMPEPYFGIEQKIIIMKDSRGIIIALPKQTVQNRKKDEKKRKKLENKKALKQNGLSMDRKIKDETDGVEEKEEMKEEEIKEEEDEPTTGLADDDIIVDPDFDCVSVASDDWDSEEEIQEIADMSNDGHADDIKEENKFAQEDAAKVKKSKKRKNEMEADDAESSANKEELKRAKKEAKGEKRLKADEEESTVQEPVSKKMKAKTTNSIAETSHVNGNSSKEKDIVVIGDDSESDAEANMDPAPNLKLKSPGFVFDINPSKFSEVLESLRTGSNVESDGDEEKNDENAKKKKKKTAAERKEAARLEELRLRKVENELMNPNYVPQSCDDFDKLVLATPDSSSVWIKYMAFHLQATEIEKARLVARRALKTISYREEQEKLNVWVALLNLENSFGTTESLKSTLDEALKCCDAYKIRIHMVSIYAQSEKSAEVEKEVRFIVKKFKETPGMWLELGTILMTNNYAERARALMHQAVPLIKNKKDSVSFIIQFALLEARNNNLEKARALMDPVLTSYPQRVDAWSTYVDMLVKANHIDEARELLQRAVTQKLSSRKMKTLFKKFLKFEEVHGTTENQAQVRKMAREYVNEVAEEAPEED